MQKFYRYFQSWFVDFKDEWYMLLSRCRGFTESHLKRQEKHSNPAVVLKVYRETETDIRPPYQYCKSSRITSRYGSKILTDNSFKTLKKEFAWWSWSIAISTGIQQNPTIQYNSSQYRKSISFQRRCDMTTMKSSKTLHSNSLAFLRTSSLQNPKDLT